MLGMLLLTIKPMPAESGDGAVALHSPFFALRHYHDEIFSALGCATDTARRRPLLHFLSIPNVRHKSKPPATVRCAFLGRVLAVPHLHFVSGYHRAVPVCANDPS